MNPQKTKIQNEALDIFKTSHTLTLEWATGTGKSRAAIVCIEYELSRTAKKWYIVCEETAHINNWKREFKDAGKEELLKHVDIFCYASLHKYKDTEANIVLDEAHVASDLRLEYLRSIKAEKVVILSATLPYERKMQLQSWRRFISFEITMDDSIKMNLLPEPRIYKVPIELDNIAARYMYVYKRGFSKRGLQITCAYRDFELQKNKLENVENYSINVLCTARQYYNMATTDMEDYRQLHQVKDEPYYFRMYLQRGSARKRFLAEYKTPVVKKILSTIDTKRLICFCGSVQQADTLGGPLAVHSEISGNENIVKKFASGEVNKIFAVKMLRSGVNLPGIECGIITQLDSKSLSFVQMMGRVFRADSPELYVLVVKETKDEYYFKRCLEGFDTKYLFNYE